MNDMRQRWKAMVTTISLCDSDREQVQAMTHRTAACLASGTKP